MDAWRRSSRCESGHCLEAMREPSGRVLVRDSKSPTAVLDLDAAAWRAFTDDVRAGRFDRD
ncbi:hypothetical protein GCM10009687_35590 [Asanoa iriomotensis]